VRILHLTDRLSDRGGAHWHVLGILAALAEQHDLLLAAGQDAGAVAPPCPFTQVNGLDARTGAPVALDEHVAAFRPDLIHVHTVVNPVALEWAAHRKALMTVQDHRYFCPTRGKWTLEGQPCRKPLERALCAGCFEDATYYRDVYALTQQRLAALQGMRLIVLSEYMRQELIAAGVAPGSVTVVPPFVHGLDATAQPDGPPCVLFVGRLAEAKGVFDAVAAWRLSGLELPLVFAGTGPARAELERLGLEVLGWVPHPRLSAVYARARAVLMPSRWQEPFGIVGLEALSMGVPVVAWGSGGIDEWHPGDGLVEWGDVPALARALDLAVRHRAQPVRGFERDPLMARLLGVYADARRA